MRILIGLGIILVGCALLVVVGLDIYWTGRRVGQRDRLVKHRLEKLGMTEKSADRYRAAVQIMERLEGRVDTRGLLAGDTLSAETQCLVGDWLTAHRKEFASQ